MTTICVRPPSADLTSTLRRSRLWPEFAAAGKDAITPRQICRTGRTAGDPRDAAWRAMLDWTD